MKNSKRVKGIILFLLLFLLPAVHIFAVCKEEKINENKIKEFVEVYKEDPNILNNDDDSNISVSGIIIFEERNNLNILISQDNDDYTLRFAANHDRNSEDFGYKGLSVIGGHRNSYLFGVLKYIILGEKVKIVSNRKEYNYKIIESPYKFDYVKKEGSGYIVDKNFDTNILLNSEMINKEDKKSNILLLYTCYPFTFGSTREERFLVFAQLQN